MSPSRPVLLWAACGALLVGLFALLRFLSPAFDYERKIAEMPVAAIVVLLVFAGAAHYAAAWRFPRVTAGRWTLAWILVVGLVLRLSLWTSTPILEDDAYRYLWDGGVAASGHNPYAYAPEEFLQEGASGRELPPDLQRLARESGPVIERVNHPHLRTIYPPVAQAAFAAAHLLEPWSLAAWKSVLLLFDAAALVCLALILARIRAPPQALLIYWWNPILIKEIYNSAHMEVVILPFVFGALLASMRQRYFLAALLLALGAGAKIWPLILLPLLLRGTFRRPGVLAGAVALFVAVLGLLSLPVFLSRLDDGSGFMAYAAQWEMNDALFMLLLWASRAIARLLGGGGEEFLAARLVSGCLLAACVLWSALREVRGDEDLLRRCLVVVAALFLLSPTQFPWYFLWVIPFLALVPNRALGLLTILLPLYYLRFALVARDRGALFDYGVVWVEFVPVWAALIGQRVVASRRRHRAFRLFP